MQEYPNDGAEIFDIPVQLYLRISSGSWISRRAGRVTQVEADFEFIVESAPDAVLRVSADGQIVWINAEAERMFGYSRQELIGQPLEILLPVRLREIYARCREKYLSSPSTRPLGAVRYFLARRSDGSEFFVDVRLNPAAAGGVVAIARDVSDRNRMNQELRELTATLEQRVAELKNQTNILESILNSIGEGVIVCDQNGKLLLVNPACLRLRPGLRDREKPLEWASEAEEFGLFLPDQLTPFPADELPLARVLKGEVVDGVEIFVCGPGVPAGTWTTVTAHPLRDGSGNPAGGVVVIRDTTTLKFAQGALLAGQEAEGKRIARELHDSVCQNICSLIMDTAELQQELPGSYEEVSERINSQKEKLMDLAEEVDSVCRQLHPSVLERIGLNQAMEQLCEEFTERKGLHTRFLHGDTPASLPAASALCLYRVTQEGLRNIVRHAQTKHATVLLFATSDGLHLSIEDDGVGFDPKTVGGKARLGLVSMQERVRIVGGTLGIHSKPGHGTRIDLRVPLLDESQLESYDTRLAAVAAA
jgi:PAS domain S-box-containing protein